MRALFFALLLLGISRLLPEHGFGLWLRLAAATLVLLLPGRYVARAFGQRSTAVLLIEASAMLFKAVEHP